MKRYRWVISEYHA